MFDDRLTISAEQQKLISNATRIQILHLLKDEALTAKQVATKLNKSTGSVHYHVQILYDGGLLELVDTKEKRGIIEKYYKAKSAHFYIEESGTEGTNTGSHIVSHLFLTPEELQQLTWEVTQVLLRWENKTARQSNSEEEYAISCRIKKTMKERSICS
ncbi:ArsR/SmtB family transcription factor [Bacillus cereus]